MTIRVECECGVTLKIKDELAGKPGKCPKCKAKFTIPELDSAESEGEEESTSTYEDFSSSYEDFSASGGDDSDDASPPPPMSDEEAEEFDVLSVLMDDKKPKKSSSSRRPARKERKKKRDKPAALNISSDEDEDLSDFMSDDAAKPADDAPKARRPPKSKGSAAGSAVELLEARGKRPKKEDFDEYQEPEPFISEAQATMLKYYTQRALPGIVICFLIVGLAYMAADWAMGEGRKLPELGEVEGIVTMDGEPLAGAKVQFHPLAAVRAGSEKSDSMARTNPEGRFKLRYVAEVMGACTGQHIVFIRKIVPGKGDLVPVEYNLKTKLRFNVEPGMNEAKFELLSNPPTE